MGGEREWGRGGFRERGIAGERERSFTRGQVQPHCQHSPIARPPARRGVSLTLGLAPAGGVEERAVARGAAQLVSVVVRGCAGAGRGVSAGVGLGRWLGWPGARLCGPSMPTALALDSCCPGIDPPCTCGRYNNLGIPIAHSCQQSHSHLTSCGSGFSHSLAPQVPSTARGARVGGWVLGGWVDT